MTDHADNPVTHFWSTLWIERDLERLPGLVTDPYVRHGRGGTTQMPRVEFGRHVAAMMAPFKGTELRVDDLASIGEMTYARVTMRGVNLTTGDTVSITWLGHYRIEGGLIAESWMLHQTDLDWG